MRIPVAIVLALLLTGCGSGYAPLPNDAGRVVRIDMSDFAFSPATISVTPGERITLSFRNVGSQEHEFMAGREAMVGKGFMYDWLALAMTDNTSGNHAAGHVGEGLRLAPRAAASLTLMVPQEVGRFEFGCFVVGHYESGMKGTILVEAGTGSDPVRTVGPTPTLMTAAPSSPGHTMDGDDEEQH